MKRSHRYYILRGREVVPTDDLMACARSIGSPESVVAQWHFSEVYVSTVFLGINHNFYDGPPRVFETMVFGGPMDGVQRRYATYDEAEAGHMEVCKKVRERVKQEMN